MKLKRPWKKESISSTVRVHKRFLQEGGKLTGVEFKRCVSVFDDQKAFRPTYDEKDLTTITADTVIVAIGQAAELSWLEKESVPITQRGGIQGDPCDLGNRSARRFLRR